MVKMPVIKKGLREDLPRLSKMVGEVATEQLTGIILPF